MKHHNIFFCGTIMATAAMICSCDDYLDIVPKGKAQLETTDDYLGLLEEVSPSYEHSNFWAMSGESSWNKSEELKAYTYPLWSTAFFWDENYDRAANTIESSLYNNCYDRITRYNALVDGIADSKGNEADKKTGLAQGRIMRAYNYFFLVNTFAPPYDPATAYTDNGIIVREKMFESIEEKGVQQSVGYTYDFIQKDIDAAIDDLPDRALNSFRPDKTFGYALKAKVHLYKREYEQCIDACEKALEAAKAGGHEIWDMTADYKKYAPLLIQMGYPEQAIDNPAYMGINDFVETIWKSRVTYGYDGAEYLLYQYGNTKDDPFPMYVTKEVLNLFERNADLRYRYCIRYKAQHDTAPEGSQDFATTGIKWNPSGMRLSEVYLMLAECYARKATPEAISQAMLYLETLRSKRCVAGRYTHLSTTDATEALRFVREERKRELFLTYNGFFDMRLFCHEFNETVTKEFEGKTYTLSPTSHLLVYPFPVKAMQNSNLKQNSK